ncbi:unnamed protein product [Parascedosporium putredinis]|uniref:Uncharacterized protein n=1 Tax=Parascedosporium putredinis TaxID=1442378 RepID=A0A9P1GYP1_9PEZI|nr:unnamed protein product [Parascedosporium putredinis]CAI7990913.1 unnamed protein product [Parascedosporium putredinis]
MMRTAPERLVTPVSRPNRSPGIVMSSPLSADSMLVASGGRIVPPNYEERDGWTYRIVASSPVDGAPQQGARGDGGAFCIRRRGGQ